MAGEHGEATLEYPFRYTLYGWEVASERALPYLAPTRHADHAPDIMVRFAPVPLPEAAPVSAIRDLFIYADARAIYAPTPTLRFLIENGRRITVDSAAALNDAGLHAILFGPPMAWLCHQRGHPPLHAGAIRIGDYAVALTGTSGAGKSTTSRALIARGHGLLSDDQVMIFPDDPVVLPGYPSIKLWAQSAQHAGDTLCAAHRIDHRFDKFHIPLPEAFCPEPAPLALIVVLGVDRESRSPRIQPVGWLDAAALLQSCIFRADAGRTLNGGRSGFAWSVALARKVPVVRLFRPDDLSALTETCLEIEHHVAMALARRSVA